MPGIMNYMALYVSTFIILAYFILYYSLGFDNSKFLADWFVLVTLSFMSASMAPAAWKSIKRGVKSGSERFIVFSWLLCTFVIIQRLWIILIALLDRPESLVEGPISGLIAVMMAIAGGYGMAAPLSGPNELPKREIITMAIAAGFSGIIAGMAIGVFLISGSIQ